MSKFLETTHLSEIIEKSNNEPVIIFKYSAECGTSTTLREEFEKNIEEKKIISPVYLVTVQHQKSLSERIEKFYEIKHESPQIIILNKGKVTYTAHHRAIKIEEFVFELA